MTLKDNEYLCNACEKGKYATFSLKEWCNHVAQNHAADPPKIEFRRQEGFDPSKRLPMTAQPVQEEVVDLTDGPEDPKTKGTTSKAKTTTTPARGKSILALTGTEDKPSVQFKCTHCPRQVCIQRCITQTRRERPRRKRCWRNQITNR